MDYFDIGGTGMKLLLAEDEVDMSEALVDILTYHKYTVEAVFDGEEALDYATIGEYDGIILDIMMPKMSGLEVLQKLRSRGDRTPVLLLTAKAEVEDRIAGLDMGADDYRKSAGEGLGTGDGCRGWHSLGVYFIFAEAVAGVKGSCGDSGKTRNRIPACRGGINWLRRYRRSS